MRQASGFAASGSSATNTGGASSSGNKSAASGRASASARVQSRLTRQLMASLRAKRSNPGVRDAGLLRRFAPRNDEKGSLPLLLRQALVELLGAVSGVGSA